MESTPGDVYPPGTAAAAYTGVIFIEKINNSNINEFKYFFMVPPTNFQTYTIFQLFSKIPLLAVLQLLHKLRFDQPIAPHT